MALGNKKTIDLEKGIILNTPIGEIDITYFEKDQSGMENVLRIINNDKSFVIIPCGNNKISLFGYKHNGSIKESEEE